MPRRRPGSGEEGLAGATPGYGTRKLAGSVARGCTPASTCLDRKAAAIRSGVGGYWKPLRKMKPLW
jgi:hypothetical protein